MSIYLPRGIYEKLPLLYLVAAAFLTIAPLSSWRFVAVVAFALAGVVTYRRRVAYRASRGAVASSMGR